jgi:MFS family permease
VAGLLVDVSPLKEIPAFRRYFFGQLVSVIGSGLTIVALRYQAYKLGGDSTFMVSMLALVTLVPLLISSVVGGSIADAFDRRRVLIVTQVGLGLCSFGLFLNARTVHPRLPVMFALAALSSALVGVDWPTRSSIVPNLVGPKLMQQAITLNISVFNIAGIIGPVIAGYLVARFTPQLFLVDALSYSASLMAILSIPSQRPVGEKRTVSLDSIADGFRYLKTQRTIQSTFAADLGAMIFGLPDALFPAMAEKVFGHTYWLGYLQAAPAIGAVLGGLFSGWTGRVRRQGRAVIVAIGVWGIGIALFGATRSVVLALFGLALAGGADAVSAVFRSTIVQVEVPEEYRGRLTAVFISVVRGGPRLGEFESGVAARVGGLQFAAVSGGLACIVWIVLVAWRYPELRAYERPHRELDDANTA